MKRKMKKYGKIWRKYEEKMTKYEEKIKKYVRLFIGPVGLGKILGLPAGGGGEILRGNKQEGGESYAAANTTPEMAPSTEREDRSPAKKEKTNYSLSASAAYTLAMRS